MTSTRTMAHRHFISSAKKGLMLLFAFVMFSKALTAQQVPCPPNLNWEFGNFTNWWLYTGTCCPINANTYTPVPVATRHTIMSGTGTDQYGGFPVVCPFPGGGAYSFKLGNNVNGAQAERARYYLHVPITSKHYSFQYAYAVVFEDPSHSPADQPRFELKAFDSATGAPIPCSQQTYVAAATIPGFQTSPVASQVRYKPWSLGTVAFDSTYAGKTVIVDVATGDCALSGHWGYGYFDMITCGDFAASLVGPGPGGSGIICDLSNAGVTFQAPPGFIGYTWYNSTWSTVIPGSGVNGQSVNIAPPVLTTTPQYFYVVMTPIPGIGCPDTLRTPWVADVTVNATPDTLCISPGNAVSLNAGATGGIPPLTYSWTSTSPGGNLSCTNCPNPTAIPSSSTSYIVTVYDSNGCFRKDTLNILQTVFSVNAGQDFTTCIGTPVQLNGVVNPMSSIFTYNWSPNTNLSNSSVANPTFTPTTVGTQTYIFMADSASCKKYDTLEVRTLPGDFVVHDTIICNGDIVQIYGAGDTNFTYNWAPTVGLSDPTIVNPVVTIDTTRVYTVTASYPTCPNMVKSVTVEVQPRPTVFLGNDTAKCEWEELPINARVTPDWYKNYIYQWAPNSTISSLTSPSILFFGSKDTTLILTVSTPVGCTNSDAIFIEVHEGNFADVTPADTTLCPGHFIQYTATGGEKYEWIPTRYLDDPTSATPISTALTSIKYTVYVTDDLGCKDTVYAAISVQPEAVLSLPESVTLYPGEQYQMDPKGNGLYFTWFPPLGLSSTNISNPVAMPPVNTRYFVHATTENGCTVTDSIDVFVKEESLLDVPNAFTPGSSPNDVLKVIKKGQATLKSFQVYNRWGNKVFETANIDEGWDGSFNGSIQPMGVYIYSVEAFTNTGKRFFKQGNVTLIR